MAHVAHVNVISETYTSNLTTTVHPKFSNVCSFRVADPIVQHHCICSAGGAVRGKDLRRLKTAKFEDMHQATWTQIQIKFQVTMLPAGCDKTPKQRMLCLGTMKLQLNVLYWQTISPTS